MLPTYLPLPSHQGGNHPRLRAEISRNNVGSDASNERGWLADVSSVLYAKFDDVMRITSSFLFSLLSTTHTTTSAHRENRERGKIQGQSSDAPLKLRPPVKVKYAQLEMLFDRGFREWTSNFGIISDNRINRLFLRDSCDGNVTGYSLFKVSRSHLLSPHLSPFIFLSRPKIPSQRVLISVRT